MKLSPTIVHAAETLALAFAGGALDYAMPLLTSGHVGSPKAAAYAAVAAGLAAVVARVRGMQFGVRLGASLPSGFRPDENLTPAETPQAKGP